MAQITARRPPSTGDKSKAGSATKKRNSMEPPPVPPFAPASALPTPRRAFASGLASRLPARHWHFADAVALASSR